MYVLSYPGVESDYRGQRGEISEYDGVLQAVYLFPEVSTPILLELQKKINCWVVDHQHNFGLHRGFLIVPADGTRGDLRVGRGHQPCKANFGDHGGHLRHFVYDSALCALS